jgi:hypothetical protein
VTDTPNQGEAVQKKRGWKPEYNENVAARRKERYKTDPEYRNAIKRAARNRYNEQAGGAILDTAQAIRDNVSRIASFGEVREVFVGRASVGEYLCLTEMEMAEAVCRNYQSFQRMVKEGRWPAPVFSARSSKTRMGVYMVSEAKALGEVYADHYAQSAHYYASHVETRTKMFNAVRAVRLQTAIGRRAMEQAV